MEITLGHSPDPDDAFMFYALAKGLIDTGDYEFVHILQDIETLNKRAFAGELDITAVSVHAFSHLTQTYALLAAGASMGQNYGPVLVATKDLTVADLADASVAIPGKWTSAHLEFDLWCHDAGAGSPAKTFVPFDEIMDRVKAGEFDAGLLIHEGQLTYERDGFHCIVDLGKWWHERTDGLPLPLGVNVIHKRLGDHLEPVRDLLEQSIQYSLDHRKEAVEHALQWGRGLSHQDADEFVGMYVNELTLDLRGKGEQAIRHLYTWAGEEGLIPPEVDLELL